jgi:hypothetical protein
MSIADRSSLFTSFYRSATLYGPATRHTDYGFIGVLALVQRLRVNILPITWQAALGSLGEGGQSRVNQAPVNIQTSLAFKRFKHSPSNSNSKHAPFQDIVGEMMILSHPAVRQHPYIIKLEGICWDIPEDDKVWPVLVFEKSHFGSLYHFASLGAGQDLSIEDRLKLCVEIGIAVRDMHFNSKNCHVL